MGAPEKEVRGLKKFFRRNSKNGEAGANNNNVSSNNNNNNQANSTAYENSSDAAVVAEQHPAIMMSSFSPKSRTSVDRTNSANSIPASLLVSHSSTKKAKQQQQRGSGLIQRLKTTVLPANSSNNNHGTGLISPRRSSDSAMLSSPIGSQSQPTTMRPTWRKKNELATIVLPQTPAATPVTTNHHHPSSSNGLVEEFLPESSSQQLLQYNQTNNNAVLPWKQWIKERDGFCRRVDEYDGHVLTVDGHAAYELGNYLGGGVAGVVYEGHRLRPMEDYPVRLGRHDVLYGGGLPAHAEGGTDGSRLLNGDVVVAVPTPVDSIQFLCGAADGTPHDDDDEHGNDYQQDRVSSLLTVEEDTATATQSLPATTQTTAATTTTGTAAAVEDNNMALEATASQDNTIIIDTVDAPSRSKHFAQAVMAMNVDTEFASDASFTNGIMEETVAIKVLNPVGFRTLSSDVTRTAVVARQGDPLDNAVMKGQKPMEERHVWWLINPNSRNLRTLQRYSVDQAAARRVQVDRGSPDKGLRISLIAAYYDMTTDELRELPLTRCIEIWGHVPFGASDTEFKQLMTAIDRINQGLPPPAIPMLNNHHHLMPMVTTNEPFAGQILQPGMVFVGGSGGGSGSNRVPGRVGTGGTDSTMSVGSMSMENDYPVSSKRTYVLETTIVWKECSSHLSCCVNSFG